MFVRLGLSVLFMLAGAAPALAGPGSCLGVASDAARGQSVLVRLRVGEGGQIENREAEWRLAAPGRDSPQGLSLKLAYVAQLPDGLGPVTSVTLTYLDLRNAGALTRAVGSLEFASGARWTAPFQGMLGLGQSQLSVKTPWGGRVSPELSESIEAAASVTVAIKGRDGKVIESLVLNPSDLTFRDELYLKARAAAEQRAQAAQPCG